MRNTFSILFYVNRSKEKEGMVPVMGRVTINGKVAQFSCKLRVNASQWDAVQKRLRGRSREAREANLVLDGIRSRLGSLYRQMVEHGSCPSAERLRNAFLGTDEGAETLLCAFDREIAAFRARVGKDRAPSSLRSLLVVRRHLGDFIHRRYRQKDVVMKELTEEFIRNFCAYLRNDLGVAQTTIWIYCTPLKRVVARAHCDGKVARNPFAQFHVAPNVRKREFLTESELLRMMNHPLSDRACAFVRDLFVFGCLTGISYIDLKQLTVDQLMEINGNWWICSTRQKTKTCYQVRLLEASMEIILRYAPQRQDGRLFNVYDYWKVNALLKQVAAECGIRKRLTFHQSRHTFATLALSKGMPIESVSRILGHSKITTTQIYARITTEKLEHDMALLDERLGKAFRTRQT